MKGARQEHSIQPATILDVFNSSMSHTVKPNIGPAHEEEKTKNAVVIRRSCENIMWFFCPEGSFVIEFMIVIC